MDVSDLGQDHGVPIDPLSIQKIEIYPRPGGAALRLAGGRRRGGGHQQSHSLRGAAGRLANANPGRHHHGRPRSRRRRLVRRRHARLRVPRRLLRPSRQRLFRPELSLSFPHRPGAALQRQAAELRPAFRGTGGRRLLPVRRRLCGRRDLALHQRLSHSHPGRGGRPTGASTWSRPSITSKGEFRPQSSAIDVVRFWLGAVEYHHDELGFDDAGLDGMRATFNNHAQEAKAEIKFMPMATPLGSLISAIGTQFDHQQIDTAGDAGSLLGSARTNRGAAYFFNEFWLTDTLRTLLAGRIETVRLDGTAGIFPSALVPPPDNPDAVAAIARLHAQEHQLQRAQGPAVLDGRQRHGAAHRAGAHRARAVRPWRPRRARHVRDRQSRPEDRDRQHRRDRAQAHRRRVPLRRQGLLHQVRQLHLPAGDRHSVRRRRSRPAASAPSSSRPSMPSATRSSAAARSPGSGICCRWRPAFSASTANTTSCAPPSPTAATFRACRRCASAAAPIGATTTGSCAWASCTPSGRATSASNDTPTAGYNLLKMEISNKQYWRDSPWGADRDHDRPRRRQPARRRRAQLRAVPQG